MTYPNPRRETIAAKNRLWLAKRRKIERLNHIAKRIFQLNAVLAVALVAYVMANYGYAYRNDIGFFIPNIGGYNFTFGG